MEWQGHLLRDLIDNALREERTTANEYDWIKANAGGVIDAEERVLLATL